MSKIEQECGSTRWGLFVVRGGFDISWLRTALSSSRNLVCVIRIAWNRRGIAAQALQSLDENKAFQRHVLIDPDGCERLDIGVKL